MAPNVSRTELDSLLLGQSVETGDYSENPDQTPAKCQSRALPAGLETIDRWMRACVNQFQFTIEELVSGRSVSSAILAASIDEGIHSPFVPAEVMPYLFETGRHAGSLLVRLPQHCAESLASHLSGGSVAKNPAATSVTDLTAFLCHRFMDRLKHDLPGCQPGSCPEWTLMAPGLGCDLNTVYDEPGECVSVRVQITIDHLPIDLFLTIPPQTIAKLLTDGRTRSDVIRDSPQASPADPTLNGEQVYRKVTSESEQESSLRNLNVEVGRIRLSRQDFDQLGVGDILMTEVTPGERFSISAAGLQIGAAVPCEQDGLRAVRVVE